MKVVFVTVSTTALHALVEAGRSIERRSPGILDLRMIYTAREMTRQKRMEMQEDIVQADAVLVDLMGSPSEVVADVYAALDKCRGQVIPFGQTGRAHLRLGNLTANSLKMTGMGMGEPRQINLGAMRKMANMAETAGKILPVGRIRDMRNLSQLAKYFRAADAAHLEDMLCLILRDYGGHKELPKPAPAREVPIISICEPATKRRYTSIEDYTKAHHFDPDKPSVALLFYGHSYPEDTSMCVAGIADRLRGSANLLPIAFGGTTARELRPDEGVAAWGGRQTSGPHPQFHVFPTRGWSYGRRCRGAIDVLRQVNAPYLHPFFMTRRRMREWQESLQGLTASSS